MKIVKVELNHTHKAYEYQTELPLEVGKTYRIQKANGWTPPMRIKVISESMTPEYQGRLTEIQEVTEEEEF